MKRSFYPYYLLVNFFFFENFKRILKLCKNAEFIKCNFFKTFKNFKPLNECEIFEMQFFYIYFLKYFKNIDECKTFKIQYFYNLKKK